MTEKTNSFKMVKKVLNKKAAEMIKKGNQRDLVIIGKEVEMALNDGYTQKAIECYRELLPLGSRQKWELLIQGLVITLD